MADDPDRLFRLHGQALKLMAHRRLRDPEASADAVQDTFLRYLSRHEEASHPPVENPAGFLRRVLANLLTNRQQRQRKASRGPEADAALEQAVDGAAIPDEALLSAEASERLRALVMELPPRGRQVIYLHKFRGTSYAEIGQRLGIAENTVMVHMGRSLAYLRRRLAENEEGSL